MGLNSSPLLPKRGNAATWTALNPVLGDGEVGYERDTKREKRGDGATAWATLPYRFDKTTADALYAGQTAVSDALAVKADLEPTGPSAGKLKKTQLPTLSSSDVGLANVSNLAPADLPVSSATAAALATITGVLVLGAGAAIPAGTPDGTPIFRLP